MYYLYSKCIIKTTITVLFTNTKITLRKNNFVFNYQLKIILAIKNA